MYVDRVGLNDLSFNAKIVNTPSVRIMKEIFSTYGEKSKLDTFKKVEEAIEKHPSSKYIFSNTHLKYDQKHTIYAVLSDSNHVSYVNNKVFPKASNAVFDSWIQFINPKNKEKFNEVVGGEYSGIYSQWWNKYIRPIWNDIKSVS